MVGNLTHIIMTNQSLLFHKSKVHSYVLTLIILLIHHLHPSWCTLLFSWYTWKSVCALPSFPSHCNLFHPKDQEHTNLYWGLSKGILPSIIPSTSFVTTGSSEMTLPFFINWWPTWWYYHMIIHDLDKCSMFTVIAFFWSGY